MIFSPSVMLPKESEYGFASDSFFPRFEEKILSVISIASFPETRMIPIAPPVAVEMAQMVSEIVLRRLHEKSSQTKMSPFVVL